MAGLGYKQWAANDVLAADDVNNYLADQVVMRFASAAVRDAAILIPTEGMICYLDNADTLFVYNGSAWVDVAPDVGTAGIYTKVTTDAKGRVTSGDTLAASDIPNLPASRITSGEFSTARIPDLPASIITSGTLSRPISTSSACTLGASTITSILAPNAAFQITSGGNGFFNEALTCPGVYNQTNTGRAVFVASNGVLGIGSSSERFKENIVDADVDVDSALKIRVRNFNYKPDFDSDNSVQIGVIAEELVELGFDEFVYFDDEGNADGVAYEKLALALIPVVQSQAARLDAVEARLQKLEVK
jgi:hypothetical protein